MSDLSNVFREGCKVVISPDKMRAWITLVPPAAGVRYTAAAIAEWLPQKGVMFGASEEMIRAAVESGRYDDLLEVARGRQPVDGVGGSYTLKIDKRPFTGLRGNSDGSLLYDDLSFLQEVPAGQVLADVVLPVEAKPGTTVTGETVPPRQSSPGQVLQGSGFQLSGDGLHYVAPGLSHVGMVGEQLVVTPLTKLPALSAEAGEVHIEGNLLVEGDVTAGVAVKASGSVFVAGRAVSASFEAGNNVLLCQGLRSEAGFGTVKAGGSVWGQFFESANITAGADVCANHLAGCEVNAGGRAIIVGGRGSITRTTLVAKGGVVAGSLGEGAVINCGLDKDVMDRYEAMAKREERLAVDLQTLQQHITAHERVNRAKADKGRCDAAYKEMVQKLNQQLSVLKILEGERSRLKRTIDQASAVAVVVRDTAMPGVSITIDSRTLTLQNTLRRTRFRRAGDMIEAQEVGGR